MRGCFAVVCAFVALAAALAEQHGCPDGPQGAAVAHRAAAAPFLLEGQQLERPCRKRLHTCSNPLPYAWQAFCSYERGWEGAWADYMLCSPKQRAAMADYYTRGRSSSFADMLALSPCDLWRLIRGRTLWIVGDSHSYDLFHALACALAGLWDYDFDGPQPFGDEGAALEAMAEHVAHFKPPECLHLLGGARLCMLRVNHGQVLIGHALPLLGRVADAAADVAVAGAAREYRGMLRDFRKAVEEEQRARSLPNFVWLEAVPTHYRQQHGLFPGGSPPYECAPLQVWLRSDGTLAASDDWSEVVLEGGGHNAAARELFAGSGIAMTQFWNSTVEAWNGHRVLSDGRGQESAHYCFPGVPNMWVYFVYKAIFDAPWTQ